MSEIYQELPDEVRELIDAPLVPFEELETYGSTPGLYELERREEVGYDVVLLLNKLGESALVSTVVEQSGHVIAEVPTPVDKAMDRVHHTFPNVEPEKAELVLRRAA